MNGKELKLVLIGETGKGKSQLGNFILNKSKAFKVGITNQSETQRINEDTSNIEDMKVTIVDTPGLNDTNSLDSEIMEKIKAKFQKDTNIDGIIYVYSYRDTRLIQKHRELIDNLIKIFGEDVLKTRLKVIFTFVTSGLEFISEKRMGIVEQKIKDIIKFLNNMINKNDIIFVNTLDIPEFRQEYAPEILKLLKKFYKIKKEKGSMNNEKINKDAKLKFIEKQEALISLNELYDQIDKKREKIRIINEKIEEYRDKIKGDEKGIIASSIFTVFTFGLSGIGTAHCMDSKKSHEKQIENLEKELDYYYKELGQLEKKKNELVK